MIYFSYKGINVPIDIENKDLPQDGQRIISLLEEKAKIWYNSIIDEHIKYIKAPFKRWFEFYTERYHLIPMQVAIYTFCKKNFIGENWSNESIRVSERAIIDNGGTILTWLADKLDEYIKEYKKKYDL